MKEITCKILYKLFASWLKNRKIYVKSLGKVSYNDNMFLKLPINKLLFFSFFNF